MVEITRSDTSVKVQTGSSRTYVRYRDDPQGRSQLNTRNCSPVSGEIEIHRDACGNLPSRSPRRERYGYIIVSIVLSEQEVVVDAAYFKSMAFRARIMARNGDDLQLLRMLLDVAQELEAEADLIEAEARRRSAATLANPAVEAGRATGPVAS